MRAYDGVPVLATGHTTFSNEVREQLVRADIGDRGEIGGPDRYLTSEWMLNSIFNGFDAPAGPKHVVIAFGESFADGLAASSDAASTAGGLLLTRPTGLSSDAIARLKYLSVSRFTIVGGPSSVSENVLTQLRTAMPKASVTRIAGANRYETAALLGTALIPKAQTVYLVNGLSYADAMAVAPLAALTKSPVVLTNGTCVDQSTLKYLSTLAPDKTLKVVAVGSTAAVSDAALNLKSC